MLDDTPAVLVPGTNSFQVKGCFGFRKCWRRLTAGGGARPESPSPWRPTDAHFVKWREPCDAMPNIPRGLHPCLGPQLRLFNPPLGLARTYRHCDFKAGKTPSELAPQIN